MKRNTTASEEDDDVMATKATRSDHVTVFPAGLMDQRVKLRLWTKWRFRLRDYSNPPV